VGLLHINVLIAMKKMGERTETKQLDNLTIILPGFPTTPTISPLTVGLLFVKI
jgi:hypothetical protein